MKADDFNSKEFLELMEALLATSPNYSIQSDQRDLISNFFTENAELEYNDFLTLYYEKYGNILKQYRATLKVKALKRVHFAATLFIVSFFAGLVSAFIWIILLLGMI